MNRAIKGPKALLLCFCIFAVQFASTSLANVLQNAYAQNPIRYYGAQFEPALSQGGLRDHHLKAYLNLVLKSIHYAQENAHDLIGSCPENQSGRCYQQVVYNYDDARRILMGQLHLAQVGNQYAIRGVYCNTYYGQDSFGRGRGPSPGKIPHHQILNTEHTWPQSRFTRRYGKTIQKTDLHHLFPTNARMNSTRGNMAFGIVATPMADTCPGFKIGLPQGSTNKHAEPPDNHKGNIARAMFYFSVRYEAPIDPYQEAVFKMWNKLDPVDTEEWNRAQAIFNVQGVRNPFIDYPTLADYITDF